MYPTVKSLEHLLLDKDANGDKIVYFSTQVYSENEKGWQERDKKFTTSLKDVIRYARSTHVSFLRSLRQEFLIGIGTCKTGAPIILRTMWEQVNDKDEYLRAGEEIVPSKDDSALLHTYASEWRKASKKRKQESASRKRTWEESGLEGIFDIE